METTWTPELLGTKSSLCPLSKRGSPTPQMQAVPINMEGARPQAESSDNHPGHPGPGEVPAAGGGLLGRGGCRPHRLASWSEKPPSPSGPAGSCKGPPCESWLEHLCDGCPGKGPQERARSPRWEADTGPPVCKSSDFCGDALREVLPGMGAPHVGLEGQAEKTGVGQAPARGLRVRSPGKDLAPHLRT